MALIALLFLIILEHGEFGNPYEFEFILRDFPQLCGQMIP